jgi:carbon monoxide dehydrogenase subunit G
MKIEGTQKIGAPRDRVFTALIDPAVLQRCIPGCQDMEKTGEDHYKAKLAAGVGSVKGVFTATVSLEDIVPPEHYRLVVEGKGQPGFVKGSGMLNLVEENGGETLVQYSGDVNVGGLLASVGQRMVHAAANLLTKRFFKSLQKEVNGKSSDKKEDDEEPPGSDEELSSS